MGNLWRRAGKIVGMICLLAACAGRGPEAPAPAGLAAGNAADRISWQKAGDRLAEEVASFSRLRLKDQTTGSGTEGLILHSDHAERLLDRSVLQRMADRLGQLGFRVLAPSLTPGLEGACADILEQIGNARFAVLRIDFQEEDTPKRGFFEATVAVKERRTGETRCLARLAFAANAGTREMFEKRFWRAGADGFSAVMLDGLKPAAEALSARLFCLTSLTLDASETLRLVVGKTEATREETALAVARALVKSGFTVAMHQTQWMRVMVRAGDLFELPQYDAGHRNRFGTANAVVAIHEEPDSGAGRRLIGVLLVREAMEVSTQDGYRRIEPGDAVPFSLQDIRYTADPAGDVARDDSGGRKRVASPPSGASGPTDAWRIHDPDRVLADINARLRRRLIQRGLSPEAVYRLEVDGRVDGDRCRADSETAARIGGATRYRCELAYRLNLKSMDRVLMSVESLAQGRGATRSAAFGDALNGIVEEMAVPAYGIAAALDRKMTIDALRADLESLDRQDWHVNHQGDLDQVTRFVEDMIREME